MKFAISAILETTDLAEKDKYMDACHIMLPRLPQAATAELLGKAKEWHYGVDERKDIVQHGTIKNGNMHATVLANEIPSRRLAEKEINTGCAQKHV